MIDAATNPAAAENDVIYNGMMLKRGRRFLQQRKEDDKSTSLKQQSNKH
jgi:hypothetical protein